MAFKIQNFYGGSPLKSSSPDKDLTERDKKRKNNRLERLLTKENPSKRVQRKIIKLEDQLERGQNGESDKATTKMVNSGLLMVDKKLDAMMKQRAALEKRIADIKAKAAKENKIGNWDDASDQLSRLNERIAEYKSKNPK